MPKVADDALSYRALKSPYTVMDDTMPFRDIAVGLVLSDKSLDLATLNYGLSLLKQNDPDRRLLSLLCVPYLDLPTARLVPLVHAVITTMQKKFAIEIDLDQRR